MVLTIQDIIYFVRRQLQQDNKQPTNGYFKLKISPPQAEFLRSQFSDEALGVECEVPDEVVSQVGRGETLVAVFHGDTIIVEKFHE